MAQGHQKKHRFLRLLIGLPLLLLATCSNLDNLEVVESSEATLSGASIFERLIGDLGFGDWLNLDLTQNETLANQGVERHQLDTVYLQSLTLAIIDGRDEQDFSFIESIQFYVSSDTLDRKLIAQGSDFEPGLKIVGLDVEPLNLAAYASEESMTITTDVEGHRPDYQTRIKADITLNIDVNVAGVLCGPEI